MYQNNVRKAYLHLAFLLLYLAIAYAADLLLLTIFTKGTFWTLFTQGKLPEVKYLSLTYIILLYVSLMGALILFWKHKTKLPITKAGIEKRGLGGLITGTLWGSILFVLFFGTLLGGGVIQNIPIIPNLKMLFHIIIHLVSCLLLAFSEEFIFRGIILKTFRLNLPKQHAFILVSLIFAAAHMLSPGDAVYKGLYFTSLFFMSLLLCIAAETSGQIWLPTGIHFSLIYLFLIRNYLGILEWKEEYMGIWLGYKGFPMASIYSIIIFALAALLMIKLSQKKKNP